MGQPRSGRYGSGRTPDATRSARSSSQSINSSAKAGSAGSPELADLGAFEVGEHEDVEQFGAGSGTEELARCGAVCSVGT
jgi:hypothetical protein